MVTIKDLFHTGYIIEDIEASMASLTATFGYSWAEVADVTRSVETEQGMRLRRSLVTYSQEGPHHVELLELLEDTAWQTMPRGPGLPHLGYWSEDFDEDIAQLVRAGFKLYMRDTNATTAVHYSDAFGYYVELVNARDRPAIERWIGGGPLVFGPGSLGGVPAA